MENSPESDASPRRGNLTLGACVLIGLAAFVGTDALASHSEAFWQLAEEGTRGSEDAALVLEAHAHRLAARPRLAALVMGSSVADSNYALPVLAEGLGQPRARVDKLWMPAMSGLELAMLAPTLRQLRPERVLVPALPLLMLDEVRWDRTRTYSPAVAARLFPLRQLFADRVEHGSRTLAASHVVVRRRSELRRALLGSYRDITALPTEPPPSIGEQLDTLRRARNEDYRCDAIHLRALRLFAEEVRDAGGTLSLAIAPLAPGPHASSNEVADQLERCLRELELPATELLTRETRPEFTRRDFRDPIHLTREAAARFTRWTLGEAGHAL